MENWEILENMADKQTDQISVGTPSYDIRFPDKRGESDSDLRNAQQVMLRILKIVDDICKRHHLDYWIDGGTLLGAVRHGGFIPWDDDLDIAMPRRDYERFVATAQGELPPDLFIQTAETDPAYSGFGKPPCKIRDEYSLIEEPHQKDPGNHPGLFVDIFPVDRMHQSGPGRWKDERMKKRHWTLCVLHNLHWQWSTNLKVNVRNLAFLATYVLGLDSRLKRYMERAAKRIAHNKQLTGQYRLGFGFDVPWVRFFELQEIYPLQRIPFEDGDFPAPHHTDSVLKQYYGDYMKLPGEAQRIRHGSALVVDRRLSKG